MEKENFHITEICSMGILDPRVVLIYPKELCDNKTFKDYLNNKANLFRCFVKRKNIVDADKEVIKHLLFDSEIEKQRNIIAESEEKLKIIESKINEDIKPYHWEVRENIYIYSIGIPFNADYAFVLM